MRVEPKLPGTPVLLATIAACGLLAACEAPTARPERITEADIITPESAARVRGGDIGIRSVPDEEIGAAGPASALVELRTNDLFVAGSSAIVSGARATLAERVAELPPGAAITIEVTTEPALATSTPRTNDLEQARANALRKFLESEAGGRWPVRAAVGTMSGPERRVVIRSDAPIAAPEPAIEIASIPAASAPIPALVAEPIAATAPVAEPAPVPPPAPEPAAIASTSPSAPAEATTAAMPAPLTTPPAEPARVASTPQPSTPATRPAPPAPAATPAAASPTPVAVTRRPPPPPPPAPVLDEGVILASGGVVEFAGAEIFEAGTFVLTAEAPAILKKRLTALSKRRPIIVQAFNDEKSKNAKRSARATRELSQVRADALAEYLRSPDGGGWTVERAVGRAFDVVEDREPDRRIEIIQAR